MKTPGMIHLNREGSGMSYNVPRDGAHWHEMIVRGEEDCDSPQTQDDIVSALYDVRQCEEHFVDGDYFVLGDRVVAKVVDIHVVPVLADESIKIFGRFNRALCWPGSITIKVNEIKVDGERDWETVTIELTKNGIVKVETSLVKQLKDVEEPDEDDLLWNATVDGVTATLCQMVFNGAVEFRSIEFIASVKELCQQHLSNQLS